MAEILVGEGGEVKSKKIRFPTLDQTPTTTTLPKAMEQDDSFYNPVREYVPAQITKDWLASLPLPAGCKSTILPGTKEDWELVDQWRIIITAINLSGQSARESMAWEREQWESRGERRRCFPFDANMAANNCR